MAERIRVAWRTFLCIALALPCAIEPAVVQGQAPGHWTVDSVPTVSIGEADGPDAYLLTNPLAGVVLANGNVVVQNSIRGLFEIRYFDSAGEYITTASRLGQGPYEFYSVLGLYRLAPDSVGVLGRDGRFAVWGPMGGRVREGRIDLAAAARAFRAVGVDGKHVALLEGTGPAMPRPGLQRNPDKVLMLDLDSGTLQAIASVRSRLTYWESISNGVAMFPVPLAPTTWVVGGGGLLWIGDSSKSGIQGYRPGAERPVVVIQCGFDASPVTAEDRRRLRAAYDSIYSRSTDKRGVRYVASMKFPDRAPFFGQLEADRQGEVWVQEYDRPWKHGAQLWKVFSAEGHEIAEVSIPAAAVPACSRDPIRDCGTYSQLMEVSPDHILVRRSDKMGVPHIEEFKVHRHPE